MVSEEQWKAMTPEEKRKALEEACPSLPERGLVLLVEERRGKVARFKVTRYNQGRQRGGGAAV